MNTKRCEQPAARHSQSDPDSDFAVQYVLPPRVTAREIAAVAGTAVETVLLAHRRGTLQSGVRAGRSLTFDASEVVKWLHAKGIENVVAVSREVRG